MNKQGRFGPAEANQFCELTAEEVSQVSGGIAESPPREHDTLARPGDTKGLALRHPLPRASKPHLPTSRLHFSNCDIEPRQEILPKAKRDEDHLGAKSLRSCLILACGA